MLTLEDLTHSLRDYGVTLSKPEYWAETPQPKVPVEKKEKTKDRVKEKRKKGGDPTASPAPKEAKIEKVVRARPAPWEVCAHSEQASCSLWFVGNEGARLDEGQREEGEEAQPQGVQGRQGLLRAGL